MDVIEKIIEIENRARSFGLSINALCETAGVARTTLTRTKNGTTSPNTSTITRLEDAIALLKPKKPKSIKTKQ